MVIADRPVPKIPPMRIPSDACVIRIGREMDNETVVHEGTPYYIHAGEWVEVIPTKSINETLTITRLRSNAVDDSMDTDDLARSLDAMNSALGALCEELSLRVVDWNWTDMAGGESPKPYRNPEAFLQLTTEELFWLINCVSNEGAEARKNGSGG